MLTSDLTIAELDAEREEDAALYRRAHDAADVASARLLLGERHGARTADEILAWVRTDAAHDKRIGVGLVDGEPVATWGLTYSLHDNLDVADLGLTVAPGFRRQGVGTRLLAHAEALVRESGRGVVQTWELLPADESAEDPTTAFATRHGYRSTLPSLRSDLELDPDDPAALDRALAPLVAETGEHLGDDYRLLTWWWDREPHAWLEERAHLNRRMSTDAPTGDMTSEEQRWDAERVKAWEGTAAAQGRVVVDTAVLHVPSGRLVAFTQIGVRPTDPEHAFQWNTLVLREHRGHRLGMAIKAANLRAAVERFPQVRRITTYNAASNAPMLRVNVAMGFRPVARETCWEKSLG
ncbi:GNAT family N-acetyltransferase [Kineosporia sp. R_H_3]|uniref:GNAT family N-acetyltransferase n=1 Tax=Kineosporia sp. R_H_3 TaxID=1961848 RepID=UPI000B4B2146|nr:GNAT family N-acetyltransferase [Kineosporia sp. R_H_3]